MTITRTTTGYSFVFGRETYSYPSYERAAEALYDLQRGRAPGAVVDAVSHSYELSSAGDGSGWHCFRRGTVSLSIESAGGCLVFDRTTIDLSGDTAAELLDLRQILNDPAVLAQLESIYNS